MYLSNDWPAKESSINKHSLPYRIFFSIKRFFRSEKFPHHVTGKVVKVSSVANRNAGNNICISSYVVSYLDVSN